VRTRREKYELERDAVAATALRESRVASTPSTRPHESLRVTASSPAGDGWMPMPVPPYYLLKPYYSTSLQLAPAAKVRPWNGAQPAPGTWY